MIMDSTGRYRATQCFKCRHLTACECTREYKTVTQSPSTQYGPIKPQEARPR